ncbi:MAG TPA: hypothetical protein VIQ99_10560 [Gammaproteobacteria bacterium]
MNTRTDIPATESPERASAKRLEDFAWAAFLIMTGALWLTPVDRVPDGTWLIGTGVVLLGLNVARYFVGTATSGFTLLLGALALAGGVAQLLGVELPLMAVALIAFGASILVKLLFTGKR